jgi:hypothetical protein
MTFGTPAVAIFHAGDTSRLLQRLDVEDARREVPYGASTAVRRAAAAALSSGDGTGAGAGAIKRPRRGTGASHFSSPSWRAAEALATMSRGLGGGSGACGTVRVTSESDSGIGSDLNARAKSGIDGSMAAGESSEDVPASDAATRTRPQAVTTPEAPGG